MNVFRWMISLMLLGCSGATASVSVKLPANSPQLSLARPYAIFVGGKAPRPLEGSIAPADAGDWYQYWSVDATSISAAALTARRQALGVRGRVVAEGNLEAVVRLAGAADHPGIVIKPAVTGDAAMNRFFVGFRVRLAADLAQRIPLPTLDLSALRAGDAPWASVWVDDCVRNGTVGLRVIAPKDATAARAVDAALAPLAGPNVYLPPASEAAILTPAGDVERDNVFRAYAGLRASGVWPEFVSDAQIASRAVSLARFRVIIRLGGLNAKALHAVDDAAQRGATVVSVGTRPRPAERVLAADYDGKPTITERSAGDGRVISSSLAPWSLNGAWSGFWQGILRDAGVPARPWLEAVTAANVGRITGKYTRPTPAK